jgi:hypothetical protein
VFGLQEQGKRIFAAVCGSFPCPWLCPWPHPCFCPCPGGFYRTCPSPPLLFALGNGIWWTQRAGRELHLIGQCPPASVASHAPSLTGSHYTRGPRLPILCLQCVRCCTVTSPWPPATPSRPHFHLVWQYAVRSQGGTSGHSRPYGRTNRHQIHRQQGPHELSFFTCGASSFAFCNTRWSLATPPLLTVSLQVAAEQWYAEYMPRDFPKPDNLSEVQLSDFIE